MSTISLKHLQENAVAVLERVEAGEEIVVERDGQAVVELRRLVAPRRVTPRPFGLAAGEFTVPDDFDAPLPDDVLRDFEGP